MPDDVTPESSAGQPEEAAEPESERPDSSTVTQDGSEEGEEQRVPLRRFREINQRYRNAAQVADWYRANIGDPKDVVAFQKWKAEQAKAEVNRTPATDGTTVTPRQQEAVRKLMRDSDPEYREMLAERERQKQAYQEAEEAMYDEAADEIERLAKDSGLKLSDGGMLRLTRQVMLEIRNDPKLMRGWDRHDIRSVQKAFESVQENLIKPLGGAKAKSGVVAEAATRRRSLNLPTAPSGGSPTSTVKQPQQKEKGINKETHDRAWALLQQIQGE